MDQIAKKVVRRFRASLIPGSWFKAKKQELAKLLKEPVKMSGPRDASYEIHNRVIPFFTKFEVEFVNMVNFDPVEESIKGRVDMVQTYLNKAAEQLSGIEGYGQLPHQGDIKGHLMWKAYVEVANSFEGKIKTLGDVLKYSWNLHPSAIEDLATKTMKKLAPEILDALKETESDHASSRIFEALGHVGFYDAAKKLLKKERATLDFSKWVDRIFEMLQANYSQEAVDIKGEVTFTQFDLNGVTVIIDDRTVTPSDTKKYVQMLDEAHARMKSKGFGGMWYGRIFIKCESCGGVNQNGGDFGVGGDYHIQKDDIRIYQRPTSSIVRLLVHELSHRYWFRHMSSTQRAKFEDLVKVRKAPTIKSDKKNLEQVKQVIKDTTLKLNRVVEEFEQDLKKQQLGDEVALSMKYLPLFKHLVLENPISNALHKLTDEVYNRSDLKELYSKYTGLESSEEVKLRRHFMSFVNYIHEYAPAISEGVRDWVRDAKVLIRNHEMVASEYLKKVEELASSQPIDTDDTRVLPVTEYGGSNIDEAFAEVVSYFVMDRNMTRDQYESMRSVLSSSAVRVLSRFEDSNTKVRGRTTDKRMSYLLTEPLFNVKAIE